MAVVTKGNEDQHDPVAEEPTKADFQAEERREPEREESRAVPAAAPKGIGGGWFHIYKPGQGYWTRMGTVGGAALLLAFTGNFLYSNVLTAHDVPGTTAAIATGALVVVVSLFLWWLLNKPTVVDFFIATESEMKKVNWTSRKELIGSTKVVIFFTFLISACLFVIDIVFGYLFYFIHVLKQPPL